MWSETNPTGTSTTDRTPSDASSSSRSLTSGSSHGVRGDQVGLPIPVAPVDRQVDPGGREVGFEGRDQCSVLIVDRRPAAEQEVVLPRLCEALARNAPPAGDVLEERQDVLRTLRPSEAQEEQGVIRL